MNVCSECGRPVGRYITFGGEGWMHADGTDAAACANARGDRPWHPATLEELEPGASAVHVPEDPDGIVLR
jgi:hypothetical protein